jgi:antitoxin (DNA-binding transcriptional repressor) of toxin-antitoxin stability system
VKIVNMHQAKTNLSRLVKDLNTGVQNEIVIMNGKTPAARLVPYETKRKRILGIDKGLFTVPDDFDEPLPEIEKLFYGGDE